MNMSDTVIAVMMFSTHRYPGATYLRWDATDDRNYADKPNVQYREFSFWLGAEVDPITIS